MKELFEQAERTRRKMAQVDYAMKLLHEKGIDEVERHALVSRRNNCTCNECFCCTARWLADKYYRDEHYEAAMRG